MRQTVAQHHGTWIVEARKSNDYLGPSAKRILPTTPLGAANKSAREQHTTNADRWSHPCLAHAAALSRCTTFVIGHVYSPDRRIVEGGDSLLIVTAFIFV